MVQREKTISSNGNLMPLIHRSNDFSLRAIMRFITILTSSLPETITRHISILKILTFMSFIHKTESNISFRAEILVVSKTA